jgi:hypothetical protein
MPTCAATIAAVIALCCPAACATAHGPHWYQAQQIYQSCAAVLQGRAESKARNYRLECTCK